MTAFSFVLRPIALKSRRGPGTPVVAAPAVKVDAMRVIEEDAVLGTDGSLEERADGRGRRYVVVGPVDC